MFMRYFVGPVVDLFKIRAALATLAGYPMREEPIPPAAPTYSPGARGWTDQLIGPPFEIANGDGLMYAPTDVDPYVGQSAQVDSEEIEVPEPIERAALTPAQETWLWAKEHPEI
jgi:hypothetical protein